MNFNRLCMLVNTQAPRFILQPLWGCSAHQRVTQALRASRRDAARIAQHEVLGLGSGIESSAVGTAENVGKDSSVVPTALNRYICLTLHFVLGYFHVATPGRLHAALHFFESDIKPVGLISWERVLVLAVGGFLELRGRTQVRNNHGVRSARF